MLTSLDAIELHDANLLSLSTDYHERSVTIAVAYYPSSDADTRVEARLKFFQVIRTQVTADLDELSANARAGNISHWVPSPGPGTTCLNLVRGFIAITAERMEFDSADA
ncbi:hypothetical protein [Pseudomonas sp. CGJS7]|uniref:hypothetical protein n=1 Tax=Pseudomonas sp. CGJS7 TaxID=3109348 RepID=UPI003009F392